jgi:hypothetical protein
MVGEEALAHVHAKSQKKRNPLARATSKALRMLWQTDAAPISQLGYSRPVPKQRGGGYSSNPRTRELEVLADKYRPGY